jgi:hypothetical protein
VPAIVDDFADGVVCTYGERNSEADLADVKRELGSED